jgi:hypothetical protein
MAPGAAAGMYERVGCRFRRRPKKRADRPARTSQRACDAASVAGGQSKATRLRYEEACGEVGG